MIKRIVIILALMVFTTGLAQAATHFESTVKTVKGDTLVVKADFAKVKWVKDGQKIKINKKVKAQIIAVDPEAELITVVAEKEIKVKVGDEVDIKKARRVMSGC